MVVKSRVAKKVGEDLGISNKISVFSGLSSFLCQSTIMRKQQNKPYILIVIKSEAKSGKAVRITASATFQFHRRTLLHLSFLDLHRRCTVLTPTNW
ncbi:hypothetical protein VNO78_02258 [Psophocarpus tetragonolobus]|uniref:Uncharacterized protein n=1 Tax=Psophocarpus tetragonolobus TaxID=3891 RepID=A0AAN9TB98_PSOTE